MWQNRLLTRTSILLIACLCLGACSSNKPKPDEIYLMPPPEVYDETGDSLFSGSDLIPSSAHPGILFATDRVPAGPGDKKQRYFTDERAYALRLGIGQVRLGKDDDVSWEEARRISLLKNRTENFPLQVTGVEHFGVLERSISPFDGDTERSPAPGRRFSDEINRRLAGSESKDVVIYVHGYKVNFENPLLVASELWHFMGYAGVMIAYSWPATFNFMAYLSDLEDAEQSSRNLRTLIAHISQETDAERIHLLGYSAGTRLVARTVADLGMYAYGLDQEEIDDKLSIGNVLLVNSDIDKAIMAGYLLDGVLNVVDSITIYQSTQDKTLNMARFVFGGDRVGQIDETLERDETTVRFLLDHPEIRLINVSDADRIDQNNGHSYFRTSPWVSSDVLMTFRYNLDPEHRGLVRGRDGVEWSFPPDYIERLRDTLRRELPGYGDGGEEPIADSQ